MRERAAASETGAGEGGERRLGSREILTLGVFFGLVTGWLEVGLRAVQRFALDVRLFLSPDVVWMAPLADLALFVVMAGILALAGRALARARSVSPAAWAAIVFGTLLFLVPLGPLLSTTRLHKLAGVLLALGVAVQGGRVLARRAPAVLRLSRRATPVLAAAVPVAVALVRGGAWLDERRHLSALPAAEAGAPNVLLLILDTVRSADLSLYGYAHSTTPHLERLAARGVTFEQAWSTSPWTLPAHASLFTGRYPHELDADWQTPLGDSPPTLAEHFATRGYRTGGFVGNLIYATYETGLDRGFARYEDYPVSVPMIVNSSLLVRWIVMRSRRWLGRDQFLVWKSAREVNEGFLAWVDGSGKDGSEGGARPFFAFLNYMDAHAPYLPPDSLRGRFGPERRGRALADLSDRRDWTPEELRAERAAYDGAIAYADQEMGYLLAQLESRGLLESTLLVVASDHGEQFGEHGLVDHGNSLYRPLLRVPLVLSMPGRVPGGARVERPVSLRDVTATIAHLARPAGGADLARPGGAGAFPGRSLAWAWQGEDPGGSPLLSAVSAGVRMPEWMPIMRGSMRSIVHDGYHYILNGDGVEELYRLDDPAEDRNLATLPELEPTLAELRRRLDATRGFR